MSQRSHELLAFYSNNRIEDQAAYYTHRQEECERATGQALVISAMLLAFTAAASTLAAAGALGAPFWLVLVIILPAMSTALVAYMGLYAFEFRSKIYGDAVRAMRPASRLTPGSGTDREGEPSDADVAGLVMRVEGVLHQEQAQWGQLASRIRVFEEPKG
jgi:hypothetical protein